MTQRKAPAGGIVRTSLDNTWQTPPEILDRVRVYFGGPIPFDPATTAANPTEALRFCYVDAEEREARTQTLFGANDEHARKLQRRAAAGDALARLRFERLEERGVPVGLEADGLEIGWPLDGTWCNPPYGRELKLWLAKFVDVANGGGEIVGLLPCARFEQAYFHRALAAANALCFIRGRVAFVSSIDGARPGGNPYASMLVGWNVDEARWLAAFGPLGLCLILDTLGPGLPGPTSPVSARSRADQGP